MSEEIANIIYEIIKEETLTAHRPGYKPQVEMNTSVLAGYYNYIIKIDTKYQTKDCAYIIYAGDDNLILHRIYTNNPWSPHAGINLNNPNSLDELREWLKTTLRYDLVKQDIDWYEQISKHYR